MLNAHTVILVKTFLLFFCIYNSGLRGSVIKSTLSKTTGRLLWTGRSDLFVNTPLGKNSIADVPHFMAGYLKKDDVKAFTFHSYRRSAATAAADTGATAAQLTDFFGWKNPSMTTEYMYQHK